MGHWDATRQGIPREPSRSIRWRSARHALKLCTAVISQATAVTAAHRQTTTGNCRDSQYHVASACNNTRIDLLIEWREGKHPHHNASARKNQNMPNILNQPVKQALTDFASVNDGQYPHGLSVSRVVGQKMVGLSLTWAGSSLVAAAPDSERSNMAWYV